MRTAEKRPGWLRVAARMTDDYQTTVDIMERLNLSTVCRESGCPNIWECWDRGEATFMILGNACTRGCLYCGVGGSDRGVAVDPDEPRRIAEAVAGLGLSYAVITSVTRDDLTDGGAGHFAAVTAAVRAHSPECRTELLVPDFLGREKAAGIIVNAGAAVLGHNIETVPRLFPRLRPRADYERSLALLGRLSSRGAAVKSGLMVGLGESRAEVRRVLRDLRDVGVNMVTIGQYLAPSVRHAPVSRYWRPEEFMGLAAYAGRLGFTSVLSGPLVRSSYRAGAHANHIPKGV